MNHTIVHLKGALFPLCLKITHGITILSTRSGKFATVQKTGITFSYSCSKVMPYLKSPNGTAGGRFTVYAARGRHKPFNLHHFRPWFLSGILRYSSLTLLFSNIFNLAQICDLSSFQFNYPISHKHRLKSPYTQLQRCFYRFHNCFE